MVRAQSPRSLNELPNHIYAGKVNINIISFTHSRILIEREIKCFDNVGCLDKCLVMIAEINKLKQTISLYLILIF